MVGRFYGAAPNRLIGLRPNAPGRGRADPDQATWTNMDIVEFQRRPLRGLAGLPNPPMELCGRRKYRDFSRMLPLRP